MWNPNRTYPHGTANNPLYESGVTIISRDADFGELNLIKGTVRVLPRDLRENILKVIDDGDNRYHVTIAKEDREIAENVACQIAQRFLRFAGGYNDIYVKFGGIELAHRKAEWSKKRLAELLPDRAMNASA